MCSYEDPAFLPTNFSPMTYRSLDGFTDIDNHTARRYNLGSYTDKLRGNILTSTDVAQRCLTLYAEFNIIYTYRTHFRVDSTVLRKGNLQNP